MQPATPAPTHDTTAHTEVVDIAIGRAHPARMQDFLLCGKNHYRADRAAAEAMTEQLPALRRMVRANRTFIGATVRHLVIGCGVRQFLDIGSGFPTAAGSVHDVAQGIDSRARVVYVDNDPIVAAHARALLIGEPAGKAVFVEGDARDPKVLLADPDVFGTLDRSEPIAVMLTSVLAHFTDEHAHELVRTVLDVLPAGSYLTISHPTADFDPTAVTGAAVAAEEAGLSYRPRSRVEVAEFFTGLDLVAPGVVPMLAWRPPPHAPADVRSVHYWVGMGCTS
ncbi:SAM-dependent methyltransferase [Pseudonocardia sp. GCM10023141]|uniref:SAM-dependent methyltransferase n=1 Tax=Pseudonocardia sp. GCM10023141 TaxID=3252653 RepID=UPI00360ACDC5